MNEEKYNEDYFIRGLETKTSLYSNYRWIPELTIPLAYRMIKGLEIKETDKVLDFGCAMGYLVKAFRLLGIDAWGYDISKYAIDNAPVDIQDYMFHSEAWRSRRWDWIICKDVLEHIPYNQIDSVIKGIRSCAYNIFVVVPRAASGNMCYVEPLYELDKTHIIREDVVWWGNLFQSHLIHVEWSGHAMKGIKDNWPIGSNLFFKLKTDIL